MKKALSLAEAAEAKDEVPVGAVLVLEDQILGEGFNLRETSRRSTSHAEIEALEDYHRRFRQWRLPPGATLYVTAEPCLMCTGALLAARLSHLVYGCSDTRNASYRRIQPFIDAGVYDHRFLTVQGGYLEAECAERLSRYFRKKRVERSEAL